MKVYFTQVARCGLGNCKPSRQLQIDTMCARSVDGNNTAAQASGQRSRASLANESTVKSHVAMRESAAGVQALGSRWLYVCCSSGCKTARRRRSELLQNLHCSANCEVSRESGTYPDSVKGKLAKVYGIIAGS